jgi:hypothetical protein
LRNSTPRPIDRISVSLGKPRSNAGGAAEHLLGVDLHELPLADLDAHGEVQHVGVRDDVLRMRDEPIEGRAGERGAVGGLAEPRVFVRERRAAHERLADGVQALEEHVERRAVAGEQRGDGLSHVATSRSGAISSRK